MCFVETRHVFSTELLYVVWWGTSDTTGHERRAAVGGRVQGQVFDSKQDHHTRKGDLVSP